MARYRKRPVEIDAIQFYPDQMKRREVEEALGYDPIIISSEGYFIETLEGMMKVSDGDYIIKGVNGEFYPCKPDIFEKTYDLVE